MDGKRKKGNGYEEVKEYVLDRLRDQPDGAFVRIVGEEIAQALGISPQMVNRYVRAIVQAGHFWKERRCYYSKTKPSAAPPNPDAAAEYPWVLSTPADSPAVPLTTQGVSFENAVLIPKDAVEGTFMDVSGREFYVVRSFGQVSQTGSGKFPASFPEVSETGESKFPETSGNIPETSEVHKKDLKEKEIKERNKNVDSLKDWFDTQDVEYLKILHRATALCNRYGAGVKCGTNPILISRFAAGCFLKIPLVTFEELEDQLKQAEKEHEEYVNWRGFGKRTGIRKPFVRIASYLRKCFETAGWTWMKMQPPLEQRLKIANKDVQQSLSQPDGDRASLPAPASSGSEKTSSPSQDDKKPFVPARMKKLINQSGLGKMPPNPRQPSGLNKDPAGK